MSLKSSSISENQIFDSLQNSMRTTLPESSSGSLTELSTNTSGGFFSFLQNISWTTWILIVIVLAIFGFNIFAYLAKGTQFTANILGQGSNWFSSLLAPTAKQTIDVSATGTKAGVDIVANTANNAIDTVANTGEQLNTTTNQAQIQPNVSTTSQGGQKIVNGSQIENIQETTLNKSLNDPEQLSNVQADDSYSSIQMSKTSNKSGWCYIGEDKGIRSCMEVGANDMCMSGDIFPTNDVCVNPNLRV